MATKRRKDDGFLRLTWATIGAACTIIVLGIYGASRPNTVEVSIPPATSTQVNALGIGVSAELRAISGDLDNRLSSLAACLRSMNERPVPKHIKYPVTVATAACRGLR